MWLCCGRVNEGSLIGWMLLSLLVWGRRLTGSSSMMPNSFAAILLRHSNGYSMS